MLFDLVSHRGANNLRWRLETWRGQLPRSEIQKNGIANQLHQFR